LFAGTDWHRIRSHLFGRDLIRPPAGIEYHVAKPLLREAEERLAIERDPVKIIDMVYVMEEAASFFFRRAVNGIRMKRKEPQITEDYERAARIASTAAP
jgi:hypothetical protein